MMTNIKQLLRIAEVSSYTSLAKSTINLWVAQGKFPKPIMLSATIKVWRIQQLRDWIDTHSSDMDEIAFTKEVESK
jgi:prophage regulatory protein